MINVIWYFFFLQIMVRVRAGKRILHFNNFIICVYVYLSQLIKLSSDLAKLLVRIFFDFLEFLVILVRDLNAAILYFFLQLIFLVIHLGIYGLV